MHRGINNYWSLIIFLLVLTASCQSEKFDNQKNTNITKDTLFSRFKIGDMWSTQVDTILMEKILQTSKFYEAKGIEDSVFKYDRLLKNIATKVGHLAYKAKGESYLAYDYREMEQYDSAFYYYNKAKNTYKRLQDSSQVGKKLLEMAKIQYRQADYYGSKESITEALQYFHFIKDSSYWPIAFNELGHNYFALKDYKNARNSYKKAIISEKNTTNQILYKNNLANLYTENKQEKLAINILQEALNNLPLDFDEVEYARLVHNLAVAQWKYADKDVFDDFQKALKIRKANNDQWGLLSSYTSLLYYYFRTDEVLAVKYADSVIQVSKTTHTPNSEKEALTVLLKLLPENIAIKDRYIFISDSLAKNELKVKNQFAFFKYENQLEKDQIRDLQTQSVQRKAELAEQRNQKIIFLGIIVLLLIIIMFIINHLKQKHAKEKLNEIFNTEKRISQQLHDELANDVFGLMTKIENKGQIKGKEFLKKLEHIYSRVRHISHENNPLDTFEDFLEDLKNLIKSFNGNQVKIVTKGLEDINWNHLGEKKCVVLYRTINELLVNMKKHSHASLVGLQLSYYKKNIQLCYKDNGVGAPENMKFGLGLNNTVSRIQNHNGTFNFTSKLESGISFEILIPV